MPRYRYRQSALSAPFSILGNLAAVLSDSAHQGFSLGFPERGSPTDRVPKPPLPGSQPSLYATAVTKAEPTVFSTAINTTQDWLLENADTEVVSSALINLQDWLPRLSTPVVLGSSALVVAAALLLHRRSSKGAQPDFQLELEQALLLNKGLEQQLLSVLKQEALLVDQTGVYEKRIDWLVFANDELVNENSALETRVHDAAREASDVYTSDLYISAIEAGKIEQQLRDDKIALQETVAKLEKSAETAESFSRAHEKRIGWLVFANNELVKENSALETGRQDTEREGSNLYIKAIEARDTERQLREEKATLLEAVTKLEKHAKAIENSSRAHEKRNESLVFANSELVNENSGLKTRLRDTAHEVSNLYTSAAKARESERELKDEQTALQEAKTKLEKDAQATQNSNRVRMDKITTENDNLRARKEELDRENQVLRAQVESLSGEKNNLRARKEELDHENEVLRVKAGSLSGENDNLKARKERLDHENGALRAQVESLSGDNARILQHEAGFETEKTALKEQVMSLERTKIDLGSTIEEYSNLDKKVSSENTILKERVAKLSEVEHALSISQQSEQDFKTKVATLEKQLESTKSTYAAGLDSKSREIQQSTKTIKDLQNQLESTKSTYAAGLDSKSREIQQSAKTIKDLQNQLQSLTLEIAKQPRLPDVQPDISENDFHGVDRENGSIKANKSRDENTTATLGSRPQSPIIDQPINEEGDDDDSVAATKSRRRRKSKWGKNMKSRREELEKETAKRTTTQLRFEQLNFDALSSMCKYFHEPDIHAAVDEACAIATREFTGPGAPIYRVTQDIFERAFQKVRQDRGIEIDYEDYEDEAPVTEKPIAAGGGRETSILAMNKRPRPYPRQNRIEMLRTYRNMTIPRNNDINWNHLGDMADGLDGACIQEVVNRAERNWKAKTPVPPCTTQRDFEAAVNEVKRELRAKGFLPAGKHAPSPRGGATGGQRRGGNPQGPAKPSLPAWLLKDQ